MSRGKVVNSGFVKCAFCDKRFDFMHVTENGKLRNGYDALDDHINNAHILGGKGVLTREQEAELELLLKLHDVYEKSRSQSRIRREWIEKFEEGLAQELELGSTATELTANTFYAVPVPNNRLFAEAHREFINARR